MNACKETHLFLPFASVAFNCFLILIFSLSGLSFALIFKNNFTDVAPSSGKGETVPRLSVSERIVTSLELLSTNWDTSLAFGTNTLDPIDRDRHVQIIRDNIMTGECNIRLPVYDTLLLKK